MTDSEAEIMACTSPGASFCRRGSTAYWMSGTLRICSLRIGGLACLRRSICDREAGPSGCDNEVGAVIAISPILDLTLNLQNIIRHDLRILHLPLSCALIIEDILKDPRRGVCRGVLCSCRRDNEKCCFEGLRHVTFCLIASSSASNKSKRKCQVKELPRKVHSQVQM